MKLHASEAAELIAADYADDPGLDTVDMLEGTVRVILYKHMLASICQGTTTWKDWLGNIRFLPSKMRADMLAYFANEETVKGEQLRWHSGFHNEAVLIWNWAHSVKLTPDVWMGHSLGGATGQIECYSFRKPGIFFSAPRPLAPFQEIPDMPNVLQYFNVEDLVPKLPRLFNRLGVPLPYELETNWRLKARHSIQAWSEHLADARVPDHSVEVVVANDVSELGSPVERTPL